MSTILARYNKLFAALALVLVVSLLMQTWSLTSGTRGRVHARFDLWRGHYAIHTYGLNLWGDEYARILRERYGIETRVDALCIVSQSEISYADSYNELSTAAANLKFGRDVFKDSSEEARREWEVRRAQSLGSQ